MLDTTILRDTAFLVEQLFYDRTEDRTRIDKFIVVNTTIGETHGEMPTNTVYSTYGKYAGNTSLLDALVQERAMDRSREDHKFTSFNG